MALTILVTSHWPLVPAFSQALIETAVSSSRVLVGEQFTLDIIISEAQGKIATPSFPPLDGFNSYSQGRSQEITIINGRTSSRSIFTYVLVANSLGKKKIGPFEIMIDGTRYEAAAVEVDVVDAASSASQWAQSAYYTQSTPTVAPPSRALPTQVGNQDIFMKAWFDKDEVYVNEPAILSYTVYTRLSASFNKVEREPLTTGFWLEEFPPEKTMRKQEQFFNGIRYVAADVRKIALFPTQPGIFTIDTGKISAIVEIQSHDDFDTFFSSNIFGQRRVRMPAMVTTQAVERMLEADPVKLTVKALPEKGKPEEFNGAVGQYEIESSLDKHRGEQGSPVTYRIRVRGMGNINTIEVPTLRVSSDLKVYDSSTSVNISKDRLLVEGEKIVDTVIVPRRGGTFKIPALKFAFFNPIKGDYERLTTEEQTLEVDALTEEVVNTIESSGPIEATKEAVTTLDQDVRYLKMPPLTAEWPLWNLPKKWFYWFLAIGFLVLGAVVQQMSVHRAFLSSGSASSRRRQAASLARTRLRKAKQALAAAHAETFFAQLHHAMVGYFAAKLGLPVSMVNADTVEERLTAVSASPELIQESRRVFDDLGYGRFSQSNNDVEHMKDVYSRAETIVGSIERIRWPK